MLLVLLPLADCCRRIFKQMMARFGGFCPALLSAYEGFVLPLRFTLICHFSCCARHLKFMSMCG